VRYRLRFLLQEFDLPVGTTVIGRSLDCNLSIEDPLVSRQHARIVIDAEGARIEDMRSRNGVRVNGIVVRQPTTLNDGDRVRIGTHDLVFSRVAPGDRSRSKTTGVLRLCASCRLPYPRELLACPHCEETEQTDDVTITEASEQHRAAWNVQLLLETLERALALGRIADAERIARRARANLDEAISSSGAVDARALGAVAAKMVAMTLATGDAAWARWVLELYARTGSVPSMEVVDELAEAAKRYVADLRDPLNVLIDRWHVSGGGATPEEVEGLKKLQWTRRLIDQEHGLAGDSPDSRETEVGLG
jgi:FHA domain